MKRVHVVAMHSRGRQPWPYLLRRQASALPRRIEIISHHTGQARRIQRFWLDCSRRTRGMDGFKKIPKHRRPRCDDVLFQLCRARATGLFSGAAAAGWKHAKGALKQSPRGDEQAEFGGLEQEFVGRGEEKIVRHHVGSEGEEGCGGEDPGKGRCQGRPSSWAFRSNKAASTIGVRIRRDWTREAAEAGLAGPWIDERWTNGAML